MKIVAIMILCLSMQGCIIVGPFITDRYVRKLGESFSAFEGVMISDLDVEMHGYKNNIKNLRGRLLLVSFSESDSLVNATNKRLRKNSSNRDTITVVNYKRRITHKDDKTNPFLKKNIFNALVDKTGRIVGTNVRKIPDDSQCDYYLDYAVYKIMDNTMLKNSFMEYKYGMIYVYKWGGNVDSDFGKWLKIQTDNKIIDVWNKKR